MGKFMRVVSTIMIIIGLAFLLIYVWSLGTDNVNILNMPSYYIVRNYWFMFVAGIIAIVFSILGSFFSWFKTMDSVKEVLPNAGYASSSEINTWVNGTTVDMGAETEVLLDTETSLRETEILMDGDSSKDSATEII